MLLKINTKLGVKENLLALIKENNPRFSDVTVNMFSLVRCGSLADIGQANKLYTYTSTVGGQRTVELKDYFVIRGVPHYGLSLDEQMFFYNRIDLEQLQIAEVAGSDKYYWDEATDVNGNSTTWYTTWVNGLQALRAIEIFDKYKGEILPNHSSAYQQNIWPISDKRLDRSYTANGLFVQTHLGIHTTNPENSTPIATEVKTTSFSNGLGSYPAVYRDIYNGWASNRSNQSSSEVMAKIIKLTPNTLANGQFLYKGKVQVNLK